MNRTLTPQPVVSTTELFARITVREPLPHTDGKSGAHIEYVTIDGERYVLKELSLERDWTMRIMGDLGGKSLQLWQSGILAALPQCINQPIVACAYDPERGLGGHGTWLLMRDVGKWMTPEGNTTVPMEQHLAHLDHMVQVQAAFWNFEDTIGLTPLGSRYLETSPWTVRSEMAIDPTSVVRLFGEGWELFPQRAPRAAAIVLPLLDDPTRFVQAVERTPSTFLHGNWKFGNLGYDDAQRTVLIDWESPGAGPACTEFAWYLSLNAARLPHSKEEAIDAYRSALERHGIDTEPWWDTQLGLGLLGAVIQFGWEKALGGVGDELSWWEDRAVEGARYLA